MKKRILALMLILILIFPVQVFALGEEEQEVTADEVSTTESIQEDTEDIQEEDSEDVQDAPADEETPEDLLEEQNEETLPPEVSEEAEETTDEADEVTEETADAEDIDYSVWTSADFTYTEYSKRLYGCDYSRDFTISGMAVEGFSEIGLQKLENNKDLVLPSVTDTGEELVGVAPQAFSGMGLTSVKFPTGMYTDYDDELTGYITKRANFVIAENAFSNNELTSVKLPDGVIAVLSYGFSGNKLKTVTLPKTIWWVETMAFARNQISKVNFPERTWFQFEMHGMPFGSNNIKSVRLPDNTAVVNKHTFMLNPGMEPLPAEAWNASGMTEEVCQGSGVVYMYTDNKSLLSLDRIHHIDKTTDSTKSWFQKLIYIDGSEETQNPDTESWNKGDFTYDGNTVTGLSESGLAKRSVNKDLVIPDFTSEGKPVLNIADAGTDAGGLFASADEKFDSVTLPSELKKIGANAFRDAGIKELDLPPQLREIGTSAFMMNSIETVVLPDTLTTLGAGAFASNRTLRKVVLSKSMTEVPAGAFGCSDMNNWMADFKSVVIPEGITKIGSRAFAGSNITNINIPEGVTEIGEYAFSTKNYLMYDDVECKLTLPSTLITIGNRAFRNKLVSEVVLPPSVTALPEKTFEKMLSTSGTPDIPGSEPQGMVTKVYVSSRAQYEDKINFPNSEFHKLYLTDDGVWTADDFTYGEYQMPAKVLHLGNDNTDCLEPVIWVITGFSDSGKVKFAANQHVVFPAEDPDGKKIQGIGYSAFNGNNLNKELGCKIKSVQFPQNVKTSNDKPSWNPDLEERGDFFIAGGAFSYNELTSLDLPEGVIYVGSTAFSRNQLTTVRFPSTITLIASQSFANNQISAIEFPEEVDYSLNIENMAFAINKIVSVQLSENTGAIGSPVPTASLATVFFQNTGVEPVTGGNDNHKKGGIVYMYKKTDSNTELIYNTENGGSYVEKLVIGTMPSDQLPWGESDFTYSDDGSVITGLTQIGRSKIKSNPAIILPDNGPDGTPITEIGDGVPGTSGQDQIGTFGIAENGEVYVPVSVKLPANLQKIGASAFSAYIDTSTGETKGLSHIDFPPTLTTIGQMAFQNAPLSSIIIPDSVTEIGNGAFTGTIYAGEIVLSESLTSIPSGAFTKTNNKIPFGSMSTVESIVIPDGVKQIGRAAFQGCKTRTLVLPEGLTGIDSNAFSNCQIEHLYIPGSVETIGSSAFAVINEELEQTLSVLEFGDGFDGTIASNAFRGHSLSKAEIPEDYSFDKINAGAFYDTGSKVKLLTSNEAEAARYSGLANHNSYTYEVVFDKLSGSGWAEDDFTYSEDGTAITGYSESGAAKYETKKDLILPDYSPDGTLITEIGDSAFAVDEEDVDIGKYDANSDGLTSVEFPKGLTTIGSKAFEYNMLTAVDLEGLKEIGDSAFHGNHLARVRIPDTVDTLGSGVFAMNSITDLKLSKNVTVIPAGAFSMNIRLSKVTIPDTVTEIGEMAFAGARLTELDIPESVVKIDRKAFHLHHLDQLRIPGNVKEIGESAFEGTFKAQTLTELYLEEGIESIGRRAFKEGLLTTVDLPQSLMSLNGDAFENNTGTGEDHVVILTTTNPDHLQFNDGATSFLVVYGERIVSLNAMGGTCEPGYLELDSNGRITAEDLPTPEYNDCNEFLGWFDDRTGGNPVSKYTRFRAGQIIYAHWKDLHEWNEGEITEIPTPDTDGEITFTCLKDESHTKTEAIGYAWDESDFTYDGDAVTGLSARGMLRVTFNPDMVIPDKTPDGTTITRIGEEAFRNTDVETVKYPEGLTAIGKLAFHTTKIKEAIIPESVTSIGEGAYAMNWNLSKISLPDGITEIPAGLFNRQLVRGDDKYDDFPSVGEVVVPDGVETIGMTAFFGLSITKVTLPEGLTEMGQSAFSNNMISEVEIPGTLVNIPRQAFSRGMAMFRDPVLLSKLTLHEGTETIGRNAFENSALVSVQLPSTIKSIDDTSFRVGMGGTPDDEKIILHGTVQQHFDKTVNTGTGLGHRFAPLITFDPAGGSLNDQYAEVNDEYKLDVMPEPVMEDCMKCDGWYIDADYKEEATLETVFKDDATLYAHWAEGHDYIRIVLVKPTADKEGIAEYVCSRNPEHVYTEPIPCLTAEEIAARDEALEAAVDTIVNANTVLASGEYTSESYKALSDAINAANALYDDPSATAEDVAAAKAEITKAVRSLKPVDKAAQAEEQARTEAYNVLARNIIDAKDTVKVAAYKAAGYALFSKALKAAEALLADENADSDALNKANLELLKAWTALEKKEASKARKIKTVTVNTATVSAAAVDKAVKKAGGSKKYVTKIILGSKVRTIKAKAFSKYGKVTVIEVRTKKLTRKSVKNSLKNSKVKKIKVNVSKKTAIDKKYVRKYKKIITKRITGKKVTVKR